MAVLLSKASSITAPRKLPLDFYSWHAYADGSADPYDAVRLAKQIPVVLDTQGFPKTESILSERNVSADFMDDEKLFKGLKTLLTSEQSGIICRMRLSIMRSSIAATPLGWGSWT